MSHQFTRDPYVDWAALVVMATVAVIFFVAYGVFRYSDVAADIEAGKSYKETAPKSPIDTESLDRVLREFDLREARRSDLERGYAGPGDPSL